MIAALEATLPHRAVGQAGPWDAPPRHAGWPGCDREEAMSDTTLVALVALAALGLFVGASGIEALGVTTRAGQEPGETAGGNRNLALLPCMRMAASGSSNPRWRACRS